MKFSLLFILAIGLTFLWAFPVHSVPVPAPVFVSDHTITVQEAEVSETVLFVTETEPYAGVIILSVPEAFTARAVGVELSGTWDAGQVSINLSEFNLKIPETGSLQINITTTWTDSLERTTIYPTDRLAVTCTVDDFPRGTIPLSYDQEHNSYHGILYDLVPDAQLSIDFAQGAEDGSSGFDIITIGLGGAVVVLALLLVIVLRRGARDHRLETEPVEALQLRKRLLTDALKTLEVEHDKKKIPDTYYQSIKSYFKHEAVSVMRELDRRP